MALVTGTGGGIMRSILMGASPPPVFVDPVYIIIAGVATPGASLFHGLWDKFRREISVMDALGLGVFVCIGTHIAIDHGLAWWAARWHGSCGSYLWGSNTCPLYSAAVCIHGAFLQNQYL